MTLLLKQIFSFIKLLNSDKGTNQIATGIACGLILGFSPGLSLQTLLILFCLFFFRIQIGAALISAAFFASFAYVLDPVFHELGSKVLETESLRPLFTTLYNMPIIPFTRFNNSVVMGAGVAAIVLSPLVYFAARVLVAQYREQVVARLEKTHAWKVVKATVFFQWYAKYERLYG